MSSRNSEMPEDWLASQYLSAETKDLEVVVESVRNPSLVSVFPAHALVLRSQSSVLSTMVTPSNKEPGQIPRLKMTGDVNPRTVEYFLRFIYLRSLPKIIHFQHLCELLTMADTCEMPKLLTECEKRLRSSISVENVCQLYEAASTINARELVEACRDFISANCQAVLSNDLHFTLLGEQRLMQVLCKTPKTLARDHEWNKKTKDGDFQRRAILRWKTWISCLRGGTNCDSLDTALEIQPIDREVDPYRGVPDSTSWIPEMYMDTKYSDVEILVEGGAKFPAHSLVLNKQSEVFFSIWNEIRSRTDLNECAILTMDLQDLTARTTEYMIRFLYMQEIPSQITDLSLMDLLSAAHKYEISLLEEKCVEFLQRKVNLTNCCSVMELAERYDIKSLSDFCYKKILDNSDKIFRNQLHFSLTIQTLTKVLKGMKTTGVIKEWSKWRCCLLGVTPDDESLASMNQALLNDVTLTAKKKKNDEENSKRNSVSKKLLFSKRLSSSDKKPDDKTEKN